MTSDNIDKSVKNFILSIVPYKYQSGEYVAKGGRILHNIEYQIPAEILKHNPFFAEFRKNDDIKISKPSKKGSIKMNDFLSSSSKYNTITPHPPPTHGASSSHTLNHQILESLSPSNDLPHCPVTPLPFSFSHFRGGE
jgi:hypothetical protein